MEAIPTINCRDNCDIKSSTTNLLPVTPVGILAEKLQQLHATITAHGSNDETLAELAECGKLASGLDNYVSQCTTPESESLRSLAEDTAKEDWSNHFCDGATVHELEREMLSGHCEGQLLKFLIGMTKRSIGVRNRHVYRLFCVSNGRATAGRHREL